MEISCWVCSADVEALFSFPFHFRFFFQLPFFSSPSLYTICAFLVVVGILAWSLGFIHDILILLATNRTLGVGFSFAGLFSPLRFSYIIFYLVPRAGRRTDVRSKWT